MNSVQFVVIQAQRVNSYHGGGGWKAIYSGLCWKLYASMRLNMQAY